MGKKLSIFGIIIFIYFMLIGVLMAAQQPFGVIGSEIVAWVWIITWIIALLIPSILNIRGIEIEDKVKYRYAFVAVACFWFLIYTFVIAIASPNDYLAGFVVFLWVGLLISLVGAFLVVILAKLLY